MHEALEGAEARHLVTGSSLRDADASEEEIGCGQAGNRGQDHDRAEPVQRDFVEMIPNPSGGLNKRARSRVELVDVALNPRKFSQQRLLVHNARVRIDD